MCTSTARSTAGRSPACAATPTRGSFARASARSSYRSLEFTGSANNSTHRSRACPRRCLCRATRCASSACEWTLTRPPSPAGVIHRRNRTKVAKIIVVTSGKGGVGKTTSSAAIAVGLAQAGHRTVVVDFDVGLRNLDLIMGVERRVVYDFVNVINNEATLHQALIRDKRVDNLSILAASQTRDKDALTDE